MARDNKNVILSMPEPQDWTIMSFVTSANVDVVETWDVERTFEAEQNFWSMLKNCRKIGDFLQWPSFRHRMSHEPGRYGVVELGFKADNRPYRVLCKFSGKKCVVLLCVCYHKGSQWTPRNALSLATERAKALDQGKATTPNVIAARDDL